MELYAFIDTNVLLHYRFFDEVDWAEVAGVDVVTLVFAPVVFAELDKRKWSGTHKEKRRADAVLKKLKTLRLLDDAYGVAKQHGDVLDRNAPR